ncbi:hypothetical protein BDN71DRAFT_1447434 [Pleurotus eryngii]|uniref:Protein kinase domain-containing protein n=1 Tax=Pleurotus eryngii TaxID=5323 RepID=A0A9P6D799_PLEER|nr:hypothetical protein BDN71DRAFT_1447434 [Pleurotus eryngii]
MTVWLKACIQCDPFLFLSYSVHCRSMCCPGKLLAQTDFSQVFVLSDKPDLVLKQAHRDRPEGRKYLAHELNMYNHLKGITDVPCLLMFDKSPEGSYFVTDHGMDLSTAGAEWPKYGKGYLNNLVASFTVSALAILTNVHGQQVIHRDIKPANFIITNNGLHLIDFGSSILAKNPAVREPHPELPYTLSFASPQ